MKVKLFIIVMLLLGAAVLAGCSLDVDYGGEQQPQAAAVQADDAYPLALITDGSAVSDDGGFYQSAWNGLSTYAEEQSLRCNYYIPAERSDQGYLEAIAEAVNAGAQLVVCPGDTLEVAVYEAQYLYPEVSFVMIDGDPHNAELSDYAIADNTCVLRFSEQQAGFLAGYAAVYSGYRNLGFYGGIAVPAVVRFGYGYVQGASYAAQELGVNAVRIRYAYSGVFVADPAVEQRAADWYDNGTQVIFSCGGAMVHSVIAAAEAAENAYIIGVDEDQSLMSERIVTSAVKRSDSGVYQCAEAYYSGGFPGGQVLLLDVSSNSVGLPLATSRLSGFSEEQYANICALLAGGSIKLLGDTDIESVKELATEAVTIIASL
ncbi:MAG: BMP family ABC transporter substrate-binding protein [Bacillota bacterium]|nr:BMP family ABC transporter substrate-binding protein [Bacillota bacterium]